MCTRPGVALAGPSIVTVPVKAPETFWTASEATEPLSLGPLAGSALPAPAALTARPETPYASVGAVLAATLTVRLAVLVRLSPSVTVSGTEFGPVVAAQVAATSAVTVPVVLVMLVTVMPLGGLAVTVRLPAGVSTSLTVAIVSL